jgi:uncharacterized protein
MRLFVIIVVFIFLAGCTSDDKQPPPSATSNNFSIYSDNVNDSFYISISSPDTVEQENRHKKFPTVYILDANLYFDVFAAIHKKYAEVGLLPQAHLVGIGYKDFPAMDSLRQRDYTFPLALAEYEMPVSGKADAFNRFITSELIPAVEKQIAADTSQRILAGHSLGGYFSVYSMIESLRTGSSAFSGFIAASPSLHYNNGYLLKQLDSIANTNNKPEKLFIAFGSHENEELKAGTGKSIDQLYNHLKSTEVRHKGLSVKSANFSEMGHMDTQIPSFIQGLRWIEGE